jgi:membrane dipeptidase
LTDPLDDGALASLLRVSVEAVQLARASEIIDLHIEPFLVHRLWGFDLTERTEDAGWAGRMFGHLDFPRIEEGLLTGGMWSITTNPARTAKGRWTAFLSNLAELTDLLGATAGRFEVVRDHAEYRAARARGAHAAMIAIQGGNALEAAPDGVASVPDDRLVRVTIVHLTSSSYGVTSSPLALWRRSAGLTERGRDFVRQLNAQRVFVDLAHINPRGFWDAVEIHDRDQPLLVTHTGVSGVLPHWRNIDDAQIRAVADTGGTIGIIYADPFLRPRGAPSTGRLVLEHMEHVISVVGDDFVSIGSDYDGAITPPPDLRSGNSYPRLVQYMLDRGWGTERIQKVLGGNFLRAFESLRPGRHTG